MHLILHQPRGRREESWARTKLNYTRLDLGEHNDGPDLHGIRHHCAPDLICHYKEYRFSRRTKGTR